MPEVFLDFLGNLSPWLLALLILLYFWGKLNHVALCRYETHPDSFKRVIGWLQENNLSLLYLKALGWLMDGISNIIDDRQKFNQVYIVNAPIKISVYQVFGFNPFTFESYNKCLRLAFLYPLFSFVIAWTLGGEGCIGNVYCLTSNQDGFLMLREEYRWLLLCLIVTLAWVYLKFVIKWQGWKKWGALHALFLLAGVGDALFNPSNAGANVFMFLLIGWMSFVTFFGLIFFELDFLNTLSTSSLLSHKNYASISSILLGIAISVLFAILFTGFAGVTFDQVSPVGFIFGSFAMIITFLIAMQRCSDRKEEIGRLWHLNINVLLFFMLSYFGLGIVEKHHANYMIFILFWILLPSVNAPLDWLSLGVTRGLLQAVRSGQHSGRLTLFLTILDLMFALVFLFIITAILVGVTALGNTFSGETLVDVSGVLNKVRTDPTSMDHWWIYFILLSTLVPTLVHFALAGGAVTLWLPRKWRLQLADGLERDVHKTFLAWTYLTFMPVIGFVLMPGALLYFLWWLLNMHGGWLGMRLLDWAEMLAHFANPVIQ